jgi:hypothetical protein
MGARRRVNEIVKAPVRDLRQTTARKGGRGRQPEMASTGIPRLPTPPTSLVAELINGAIFAVYVLTPVLSAYL